MSRYLFILLLFISLSVKAQDADVLKAFDFWVGEWEAHWIDANGNEIIGENRIEKIMGGSVFQEHFSDTSTGFLGGILSVFSPADSLWHQAWADNSGGYIDLVGIIEKDIRIFQTRPVVSGDNTIIRRMLFYNIGPKSFDWDWEISTDGDKTWALRWRIKYIKKN